MNKKYKRDAAPLRFASPSTVSAVLGVLAALVGGVLLWLCMALAQSGAALAYPISVSAVTFLGVGTFGVCLAVILALALPDDMRICQIVRRGLLDPTHGNPLHLQDGELLPSVQCRVVQTEDGFRRYILRVYIKSCTVDDVKSLASFVSSTLTGRYHNYAVTQAQVDISFNFVDFVVEDVTIDRAIVARTVDDLRTTSPTTLKIQDGTTIDLTASGSILEAGKTRSGKTTGVIALLLQVLAWGKDKFGSLVMIVDPKRAELSRLPGVVTTDEDGGGRAILAALQKFAEAITQRQAILNEMSEQTGDAVHWWEAKMHPSFLFLDEFVACRTLFPRKADKEDPEYCLATFDAILKRIVTMGASAGCYVIISIAEASVEEGGLPAMLRSAMGTRILFKPTLPEAKLLWSADKLEAMLDRGHYNPGEAWFSSTDGEHDEISFVRFPRMEFPVYAELGRLLRLYGVND